MGLVSVDSYTKVTLGLRDRGAMIHLTNGDGQPRNLYSTVYQVLKSKDEDFQISVVCVLVIKFFALVLGEVDVLNVNNLISSFYC